MKKPKITDAQRLDWLERFVNEHEAILLHTGHAYTGGHHGIGLRPGNMTRTLREAIDSCAAGDLVRAPGMGAEGK